MENVDLLVKNTKLYNSYLKMFTPADVYILGERIYFVDTAQEGNINAKKVIDGSGYYMLPGFIDIHMHIESSMMTPASFGERAASCANSKTDTCSWGNAPPSSNWDRRRISLISATSRSAS